MWRVLAAVHRCMPLDDSGLDNHKHHGITRTLTFVDHCEIKKLCVVSNLLTYGT